MDQALFNEAKRAYEAKDFRSAAKGFLSAAGEDPQGSGAALHMAGNALMRLKRHADAATAYEHALEDVSYDRAASVCANLGAAYRAAGHYDRAVQAYDLALEAEEYSSRHSAHQGRAGALYDMGRLDEAAQSYRDAALESSNPDPGKALNNLGLCYMALGRPEDAVEAYEAASSLDQYSGAGRTLANLGLALSVLGEHERALAAFGRAVSEHDFELTGGLEEAFRTSTDAVASVVADVAAEPERAPSPDGAGELFAGIDEPESDFFTRTDADMRAIDKESRREERRGKRTGRPVWVRLAAVGIVVAVVAGGLGWAWMDGAGWPTQRQTVRGLMDAYGEGQEYAGFWVGEAVQDDVVQEMGTVPPKYVDYTVGTVDGGASESRVEVVVVLESGAELSFEFTLAREGVGWRVSGVDNDWRSTGGS